MGIFLKIETTDWYQAVELFCFYLILGEDPAKLPVSGSPGGFSCAKQGSVSYKGCVRS